MRNAFAKRLWLVSLACSLSAGAGTSSESPERAPAGAGVAPANEHWRKTYGDFHALVDKLHSQVSRHFYPEFIMIRQGNIVATVQIDSFGAQVLKEADGVLQGYREGLQLCVEKNQNEYRASRTYSYERFSWFLDSYVRLLVRSLSDREDPQVVNGVKERVVTTDRTMYAYTRLLTAYVDARAEKFKNSDPANYASDRAMSAALADLGRRVLKLDLTQKFDLQEMVAKGPSSQPVFRDLASFESVPTIPLGVEPLTRLLGDEPSEPTCLVKLSVKEPINDKKADGTSFESAELQK